MNIYTLVNTISFLSLLLLVVACSSNDDSKDDSQDEITAVEERPWLLEEEFSVDVTLHATNFQTVVLDLENSDNAIVKNSLRFVVEKERSHRFCVAEFEQHILHTELIRDDGDTVIKYDRGGACEPVTLEAGRYLLNIYHDGSSVGSAGVTAFLHQPAPMGVSSTQLSYYTLPTMDMWVFRGPEGGFVSNDNGGTAEKLAANSEIVTPSEVWQPHKLSGYDTLYKLTSGLGSVVSVCKHSNHQIYSGPQDETCDVPDVAQVGNFRQSNHGLGLFQFTWGEWYTDSSTVDVEDVKTDSNHFLNWLDGGETPVYTTEYEGHYCDTPCIDDATLSLETGQIALYKSCNYQGPAFVFMADINDISIYADAAELGLGISINQVRSIRLGNDTVAQLYPQANQGGTVQPIVQDTPCLDATELGNDKLVSFSIFAESVVEYIVSSNGCVNCNLTGIDLSNQDFTGYDFTGSAFVTADLDDTDFSDANLSCASFSRTDVSNATFEGITIARDFSCNLDLLAATTVYSNFDKADWRYMNLSGSMMTGLPDTLSTISDPLDLSGALLSNVTWLAGKKLDGVNLGCYALEENQTTVCPAPNGTKLCSTLQGISLVGSSLERACMDHASMEGAFLTVSNLDGADLSNVKLKALKEGNPATLNGAFMRNVKLTGADITGVSMNNVNFYTVSGGTADATDMIATGADFSDSYLAFADFSGSTSNLQSTIWSNAMLLGVTFEQADLSKNTSGGVNSGTATNFTGAYMQGTEFSDAILDDANFTNTYWDTLGSGGKLNFLIPRQNLGFTGYWKDISLPECPLDLTYVAGNPPPMNVTNANNTCPNGGPGPCDSWWGDPAQDISLAFFQSAVVPLFPQDPSASAENQCSSDSNPVDFCWTTTNNPTLCPENVQDE